MVLVRLNKTMAKRVIVSWSTGKDAAWALYTLRQDPSVQVVGLLTTCNEAFDRTAMHGARRELLQAQAAATGLPVLEAMLPWPCSNEIYETRMETLLARAVSELQVDAVAFGDLFLEDVRDYRIEKMKGTGIEPIFPIWGIPTNELARTMIAGGLQATLTCVDPRVLPAEFAGRRFDLSLLADLPEGIDPCGERGEFHSFCHAGPMFQSPILVKTGEVVHRDGFVYADVLPVSQ